MIHLSDDPTPFRVVGIDPGTDTLGAACLDIDLYDFDIHLREAHTLQGSQLLRSRRRMQELHGARFARLDGLEGELTSYFYHVQPHAIISESPYLGRFAATYAALTECMTSIRRAVMRYNDELVLNTIDPAQAKANIGVSGKSGDKTLMTRAILRLIETGHLRNPEQIAIESLDEHSIDAIGIGYFLATRMRDDLRFPRP